MTVVAVLVIGEVFITVQALRPTPVLAVEGRAETVSQLPGNAPQLAWPGEGEAAVDVAGFGSLGQSGGTDKVPIASLTKVMTALVVLRDRPLSGDDQGPSITFSQSDVVRYATGILAGQSVLAVNAGESLSERQALEALLVGSADNIATTLAIWDADSVSRFVREMNSTASQIGLGDTHYDDESGLSPDSVSTAPDQLKLSEAAMANPVIAAIVAQPSVDLPVAGHVKNTDYVLGQYGIIGIKTGNTEAAGGCYLFAADLHVAKGKVERVYGALLGQGRSEGPDITLPAVINAGVKLLQSVQQVMTNVTVLGRSTVVASVEVPWGPPVPAVPSRPVQLVGWSGLPVKVRFRPEDLGRQEPPGTVVGNVEATLAGQRDLAPVVAVRPLEPPLSWRLGRL